MEKEIIVKWKIKESETLRLLKLLPLLVENTRKEAGNISYNIYQSVDEKNVIILHEKYADSNSFELHKQSAHYQEIVAGQIIPFLEVREVSVVSQIF